jgi:hypothetical protein
MREGKSPAERGDWWTYDMPIHRVVIPVYRAYSAQQMESIKRGFVPQMMDHKWFAFYEDLHLYLHRSWTGFCIYIVRFEELGGRFFAREIVVNRDRVQYNSTDSSFDVEHAFEVIDFLLLGLRDNHPHFDRFLRRSRKTRPPF